MLTEYHRKRDFRRTPEPKGGGKSSARQRHFVVQKHAASRLHYDFRLELGGVLLSWAVPKGPSLDPAVKSLAVQVEDHPLDYANFEGVIPAGEYGGGTVMVWDQGTWSPEGDPEAGYKSGHLSFRLEGEKLRGQWSLIRMKGKAGEDGKNWLLIKKKDKAARPASKYDVLTRTPKSVLTGRDLDAITKDADRVWSSNGAAARSKKPGGRKRSMVAKSVRKTSTGKKVAAPIQDSVTAKGMTNSRRRKMPTELKPQLATLVTKVPEGDGWLHEIKFDGYRIVAFVNNKKVHLITRNGNDWTERFENIAQEVLSLAAKANLRQAIIDGEVVALEPNGVTSFQRLQNWLKRGKTDSLVYYAFDLIYVNGYDVTEAPLVERKELLARVVHSVHPENDGVVRYSDHVQGQAKRVLEHACRANLEGILSKDATSTYQQGRSRQWLKIKCLARQEFVIGGYTKPTGSRTGFGALLLGYYNENQLCYCGRVGTGFTDQSLRDLTTALKRLKTDSPPFAEPPTGSDRRGVTWVEPKLVCEVEFSEWTQAGTRQGKCAGSRLRHPSFKGLREDKRPQDVKREQAQSVKAPNKRSTSGNGAAPTRRAVRPKNAAADKGETEIRADVVAGVRLTHPDRVLYPQQKLTKLDLAKFYESIGDWILPHVVGRPLTLVRCPKGSGGDCFYQKHLTESMPDTLGGVWIKEKRSRSQYVVIEDLAGLVSLVQMGVLEIHPWPARTDDLEHPDRIVLDLDPGEGTTWKDVMHAARDVRERLSDHNLVSFLRTSGGKGLHVVAPLVRRAGWDRLKEFAKSLTLEMVHDSPDRYTANMSKSKRGGKIFVDYLRNQEGATAVASYSTRARAGAPVATPVRWNELNERLAPDKYNVENLPARLAKLKSDPWVDFFKVKQSIRGG